MKFGIESPLDQFTDLARRCVAALNERQRVRQTLADRLRPLVLADFDAKSRGGTGADRTRWAPDSPETVRRKRSRLIGIESGDLRDSLEVTAGTGGDDVSIAFTAPHAVHFDKDRPLLPEELPDAWAEAIGGDVIVWATTEMQDQID